MYMSIEEERKTGEEGHMYFVQHSVGLQRKYYSFRISPGFEKKNFI